MTSKFPSIPFGEQEFDCPRQLNFYHAKKEGLLRQAFFFFCVHLITALPRISSRLCRASHHGFAVHLIFACGESCLTSFGGDELLCYAKQRCACAQRRLLVNMHKREGGFMLKTMVCVKKKKKFFTNSIDKKWIL